MRQRRTPHLPKLVNERANLLVINPGHAVHGLQGKSRQVGGSEILLNLVCPLGTWNRTGDRVEHQDPPECQLG